MRQRLPNSRFETLPRRFIGGALRGKRRGAAVVELAVLLPLLVFLFVIAVDFARIFYYSVTLTNCARAGALYASDPTTNAESAFTSTQAAALADATNLSPAPTVTSANGVDAAGRPYVEVTAAYTFRTITGFPGVPNQVNLTRTVRMNVSASTPN
jgi:Flp pilus assembly protein TadG